METSITSYLTFDGNCREAMHFYMTCLGGDLNFETIGDSFHSNGVPATLRDCVVQATLRSGCIFLQGSDLVPDEGLLPGNAISLLLQCKNLQELKTRHMLLSRGGTVTASIDETAWGSYAGSLKDRFGNHWLLSCPA